MGRTSFPFRIACLLILLSSLASLFFPNRALAFGGRVKSLTVVNDSPNWIAKQPRIVIAFGYLEPPIVEHFSRFLLNTFQRRVRRINPELTVSVIRNATGSDVVDALKDRNTVGFIFVSHTFKSSSQLGLAWGADSHILPAQILSAATPALRFASILGCHGPSLLENYQIKFELERIPGNHTFFYSDSEYLRASSASTDGLKRVLLEELKQLNFLSIEEMAKGIDPPPVENEGTLTVRAKDVFAYLEPRYIRVNQRIVGVLGADLNTSNDTWREHRPDYLDFKFSVPELAQETANSCHHVRIIASDLSPEAPVDHYLIQSLSLTTREKLYSQTYDPPILIGESLPPSLSPMHGPSFKEGDRKARQDQYFKYILNSWKHSQSWTDPDPGHWVPYGSLKGVPPGHISRFFTDSICPSPIDAPSQGSDSVSAPTSKEKGPAE